MAKDNINGLAAVADESTEIMVLGSFPGKESRKAKQYYAQKGNDFWKVWQQVLGEPLASMNWDERKSALLKHGIGLWDVFSSAEQEGSSDDDLKNMSFNDFAKLIDNHNLKLFLVSGTKAYNSFLSLNVNIAHHKIQSTSGANRRYSVDYKANEIKSLLREHNIKLR